MLKAARLGIALSIALLAPSLPAAPAAVTADQRADSAIPAGMDAIRIPSGGDAMNAIVYTPGGSGPHPALILFHGFPGNEQNLDLAQAARRAGFVVLTLHYRGSWGSPGKFSFASTVEDGSAALAWLQMPTQIARYNIDSRRIVLAGHSMGGFVAAKTASEHPEVSGLLLIDAWNIGAMPFSKTEARARWIASSAANILPLAGTTTDALADEIFSAGESFDIRRDAPKLASRPLIIFGAARANGASNTDIANAVVAAGGKSVTGITMPTDHGFNDHRIALITASLEWLQQFTRKL